MRQVSPYRALSLGLSVLVLLGASSGGLDTEALLREGDVAFARGDFAAAADLYERASLRATDPSRATLSLAEALYRRASRTAAPSQDLEQAEELLRCCAAAGDPRRDRALFGLGNCLTRKAAGRDAAALRGALEAFDQCLALTRDEDLAAAARYNHERARLLLQQVQPLPEGSDRPTSTDPNEPPPPPDPLASAARPGDAESGVDAGPEGSQGAGQAPQEPGKAPARSDAPPPPGAGNLPPIPDRADVTPLTAREAAEHLEQAQRRIAQERQSHRRRVVRPASDGVPAW